MIAEGFLLLRNHREDTVLFMENTGFYREIFVIFNNSVIFLNSCIDIKKFDAIIKSSGDDMDISIIEYEFLDTAYFLDQYFKIYI